MGAPRGRCRTTVRQASDRKEPIDWVEIGERYAADPTLSLTKVAQMTGRSLGTVKAHYERRGWAARRREVQAKSRDAIQARLQEARVEFAVWREREMLKIARRGMRALALNLKAPAGEDGFGSDKVDAHQVRTILKAVDEAAVVAKDTEQLTPLVFQTLDRAATDRIVQEKLAETRAAAARLQQEQATTSTPKTTSVAGRVASLFSRRSGTS